MNVSALLTSAGINIGISAVLLCSYSILKKQPSNVAVYFGRRLAEMQKHSRETCISLERLIPSASWIVKACRTSEAEVLSVAGLDAVVFLRSLVFSIRIFSIAAILCMFLVLPFNYHGQEMRHKHIPSESLDVFTIENVKEGSEWLWVHCLVLYLISCSACILLYFEYRSITKMRLAYITESPPNPSQFTVLVRSIPKSTEKSRSESVKSFFEKYYGLSYLSHQMIYRVGKVDKLMNNMDKIYRSLRMKPMCADRGPVDRRCGICGVTSGSLTKYSDELQHTVKLPSFELPDSFNTDKECDAAFVIFKTRYAAIVTSRVLQFSNPMLWVSELAPSPNDVYWSNLWIPFRQLWIRRLASLLVSLFFVVLFLPPVTFVQGLSQLEKLQKTFPFLKGILKKYAFLFFTKIMIFTIKSNCKITGGYLFLICQIPSIIVAHINCGKYVSQLVTGYLPSVILLVFLLIVPPIMLLLSSVEGFVSRSGRKRSACCKILYFMIWNVFFVNVLSGTVINQLYSLSSAKDVPTLLAKAVPRQATFFITYVLTSGWTSLSFEIVQPFALLYNLVRRFILRNEDEQASIPSFPYHTEVPRVLLFGLLGFTCSVLSPLILPILLVYYLLGYVVYRNQILNVYITKYESGGLMWPVIHNATMFSLLLTQIIALGVFGLKKSPVASGFIIPLLVLTLLFNEYCRKRFHPVFKCFNAQDIIDMDRVDELQGRMDDIHEQLLSAYPQFPASSRELVEVLEEGSSSQTSETRGLLYFLLGGLSISRVQGMFRWLAMVISLQIKSG